VSKKGLLRFSNEEFNLIKASGEENLAGIAALGKSLLILGKIGLDLIAREEKQLLTRALDGMNRIKGLTVYGIKDPQSTSFDSKGGVISFSMKGIWPDRLARKLSSAGIGVRYGCHCAHILVKHILHVPRALEKFQHVMLTLLKKISLPGVVRISIGIENTEADIDTLLDELKKIAVKQQVSREKD
jgi:selenocysteine lyase/cysteine desulfurase